MRRLVPLALVAALCACSADFTGQPSETDASETADRTDGSSVTEQMSASDPRPGQQANIEIPDSQDRPVMQRQVVLDRLGFTPGVVDGKMGMSTTNAISGFQEANDLDVTGEMNDETEQALARWDNIPATRVVTVPEAFASGPFKDIPDSAAEQAKMERLGYKSLDEKLAERFHTTIDTLKMLNPGGRPAGSKESADASGSSPSPESSRKNTSQAAEKSGTGSSSASYFSAGQKIRVPNVGADRIAGNSGGDAAWIDTLRMLGVGTEQPKAARIVVSKSEGTLKVFDDADKLVGMYTATMGSKRDPLPLGDWKVVGVAHNPPFSYNPELFWDVPDTAEKQTLPPGPNGPVGVVWIDLSKEHYGIHGTPEPQTIGRVQSHGCVRLTNWDAARLAQMVSSGTEVIFEA